MKIAHFLIVSTAVLLLSGTAKAADYTITLENHKFCPANLEIPANEKVKVTVKNMNDKPAEFESHDFKREKIIGAGKEATIVIGPLKPGKYEYFDEFHEGSKGTIEAVDKK